MRFTLLDRIVEIEGIAGQPGIAGPTGIFGKPAAAKIKAVKSLSLAEEYLADHFPQAPVMPGVLMLEALIEASAWLTRASEDFAHSIVLMREVRAVKYASFVEPGQTLTVTAEIQSQDERDTKFKAQGVVDGEVAVSARLVLERYNLGNSQAAGAATDAHIVARMRELFGLLYREVR